MAWNGVKELGNIIFGVWFYSKKNNKKHSSVGKQNGNITSGCKCIKLYSTEKTAVHNNWTLSASIKQLKQLGAK